MLIYWHLLIIYHVESDAQTHCDSEKTGDSHRSLIYIHKSRAITPEITLAGLTTHLRRKRRVLTNLFPLFISFLTSSMENPPMLSLSEGDVTRAEEKSCKGQPVTCATADEWLNSRSLFSLPIIRCVDIGSGLYKNSHTSGKIQLFLHA